MFVLYFSDGLPSEGRIAFLFLCTLITHRVYLNCGMSCLKSFKPYSTYSVPQLVYKLKSQEMIQCGKILELQQKYQNLCTHLLIHFKLYPHITDCVLPFHSPHALYMMCAYTSNNNIEDISSQRIIASHWVRSIFVTLQFHIPCHLQVNIYSFTQSNTSM